MGSLIAKFQLEMRAFFIVQKMIYYSSIELELLWLNVILLEILS